MTTIQLTDSEAKSFLLFREHQSAIEIMLHAGVFDMRRGSIEIHFDMEGNIGAIVGHPTLYKRDHIVLIT